MYNRRFSVYPKGGTIFTGISSRGLTSMRLYIETKRTLRNGFTVAHNRKLYQIADRVKSSKRWSKTGSMVHW